MLVQLHVSAVMGVSAQPITIEVNCSGGIGYHLVGLPDNAVRESNYRIAAAFQTINTNFQARKSQSIWLLPISARKAQPMT